MLVMDSLFLGYQLHLVGMVISVVVVLVVVEMVLDGVLILLKIRKQVLVEDQHLPYKVKRPIVTLVVEGVVDLVVLHQKTPVK